MSVIFPLLLALSIPLLLWAGGKLNISPGWRLKLTGILILAVWTLFCLLNGISFWSWLAGILCLSSILILSFMLWSVLCWGYTLSMLLRLAEANSVANQEEWEKRYAGAQGISELSRNRAQVLLGLGFANQRNDDLVLTPAGRIGADLLGLISRCFGISS